MHIKDNKKILFLKEKLSRFKPIVIIKKNILLISILLIFSLSILLGLWNMQRYEIYSSNGEELESVNRDTVEKYIEENIFGRNFFYFSPQEAERSMYMDIPFIKDIKIEKVMPNKIVVFLEIYKEEYATYLKGGKCNIVSSNGTKLKEVCEEDVQSCCLEYSVNNQLPFLISMEIDISNLENDKDKLLIMEDISKVVTIARGLNFKITEINLAEDILEIKDDANHLFRFSMINDFDVQLKRLVVVVKKLKGDSIDFTNIDLRFERPVMTK